MYHRPVVLGRALPPDRARVALHARTRRHAALELEVGWFHPAWGDIHLGPDRALEALALLGGGAFLPVHWTFSLATHARDQPAEALLKLGPKAGARLVMPLLGEPVEPAHAEGVKPWCRVVDTTTPAPELRDSGADHAAEGDVLADRLDAVGKVPIHR